MQPERSVLLSGLTFGLHRRMTCRQDRVAHQAVVKVEGRSSKDSVFTKQPSKVSAIPTDVPAAPVFRISLTAAAQT